MKKLHMNSLTTDNIFDGGSSTNNHLNLWAEDLGENCSRQRQSPFLV